MFEQGDLIDNRYSIVRHVGKGGMSDVYEATNIRIGKRVAIKVLFSDKTDDDSALRRFQQEAKIAGSIGHVNICEVYDFGVTGDGRYFIVMEYLDGESLKTLLDRESTVPLGTALTIAGQILDALITVHERGIIHRDLKPGNVMITTTREGGAVVKLFDFGISKIAHKGGATALTKKGTMLGTPLYMSPEQIKESKTIDHRTDLYSVGVMLFKMLAGKAPYQRPSMAETIISIMTDPIPDVDSLGRSLPRDLKELLRRSMEKEPGSRIESAARFKEEIQKIQAELSGFHTSIPVPPAALPGAPQAAPMPSKGVGTKVAVIVGISLILVASILTAGIVYYSKAKSKLADALQQNLAVNVIKGGLKKHLEDGDVKGNSPSASRDTVRIEFLNVPKGGRIMQDDAEIVGTVAEVKKGVGTTFIVKAEGFEERKIRIVPMENGTIDAALTPVRKSGPAKPGQTSKSPKPETPDGKRGPGMEYVP
jgi:serine/threonine protein kinase